MIVGSGETNLKSVGPAGRLGTLEQEVTLPSTGRTFFLRDTSVLFLRPIKGLDEAHSDY